MASGDHSKGTFGKQIEGVQQKMEELDLKNMDLNKKSGLKYQTKFRYPSATYMEKLRAEFGGQLEEDDDDVEHGNDVGNVRVRRVRLLDRQKNQEFLKNILREENAVEDLERLLAKIKQVKGNTVKDVERIQSKIKLAKSLREAA